MSMELLVEVIADATSMVDKEVMGAINNEFFHVFTDKNKINGATLIELINNASKGEFCDCEPLDGKEHNYLELGAWIGSQELALRLMCMGHSLGIWTLLTPSALMPTLPKEMREKMAGMGMVTIQAAA